MTVSCVDEADAKQAVRMRIKKVILKCGTNRVIGKKFPAVRDKCVGSPFLIVELK